jgi:hypothetical protein
VFHPRKLISVDAGSSLVLLCHWCCHWPGVLHRAAAPERHSWVYMRPLKTAPHTSTSVLLRDVNRRSLCKITPYSATPYRLNAWSSCDSIRQPSLSAAGTTIIDNLHVWSDMSPIKAVQLKLTSSSVVAVHSDTSQHRWEANRNLPLSLDAVCQQKNNHC